jgi:hypothetical protein
MSQLSDREKSAIDAIYDMENRLKEMEKKLKASEGKLDLVLAKLDKLSKQSPVVKINSPPKSVSQQKVEKLLLGAVKVFGHIVNKSQTPLVGVQVKIYDDKNELVKDLKTDDNGYWEARLPGGRYGVEYLHKNFKPVNKTIEFKKEDKSYEVR